MTRSRIRGGGLALGLAALAACLPALDWREVRPEGAELLLLFPCRPASQARQVALAGAPVPMRLHACAAAGATFLFGVVELADPARVGPVLAAWRAASAANLGGAEVVRGPMALAGATPNAQAARVRLEGRAPDGVALQEEAGYFVRGLRLYRVAVIAPALDAAAVQAFFESLRLLG